MAYKSPVDRLMSEFGKSYMRMSLKELEVYARRLQKIANRRYDTIAINSGNIFGYNAMNSDSYKDFENSGGRISLRRPAKQTPKERLAQLRHEVSRAQKFVNSAHTSIKAQNRMSTQRLSVIEKAVGAGAYEYYKKNRFKNTSFEYNFWHLVDEYRNQYYAKYDQMGSNQAINAIFEIFWREGRSREWGSRKLADMSDAVQLMILHQLEPEVAYDVMKNVRAEYNRHRRKDNRDIIKLPRGRLLAAMERVATSGESYIDALRKVEADEIANPTPKPKKKRSSKKKEVSK